MNDLFFAPITAFRIVKELINLAAYHKKPNMDTHLNVQIWFFIDLPTPPKWWSQAGSNRRPPACKAGALPAELWPRVWWVWEELNFRPHPYQGCALTN